ncbi:MAG: PLP-dependent aminotransferase family protein [Bacteroidales bacterium]|nr:PLP-dependent aminotransferase family protein [Bacteroidales bacterium]
MDYSRFFSDDVPSFLRSPVREIFRKVDLASIYSFAGGYPDASTFPLAEMEGLTRKVVEKYGARALQYGGTQGVTELREIISQRYGVPIERVQITTSSQQGIDVCARVFLNPGDVVFTTYPAYLGALQSFRAYRAAVAELASHAPATSAFVRGSAPNVPRGSRATDIASCGCSVPPSAGRSEERLVKPGSGHVRQGQSSGRTKLIYIVPDFCNPSGETMSLEERQALVEFARRENLLIVEDSPYRELRYSGESIPTIYSLAPERTLHLGSFSKIFAPGFRLGWIIAEPALLEQIFVCKQALDLCPPVFDQYLAAEFMGSGALDRNLERSISLYRDKRDYMVSLLEKYMPDGVSWTHPDGGLFLWVTLPEGIDTVAMYDSALAAGVAYVAGSFFFPDGSHRNTMRLNFSYLAKERMEAGVQLLAAEIKKVL